MWLFLAGVVGAVDFFTGLMTRISRIVLRILDILHFYDPTYEFDYPSHVPSERAANLKGVCYDGTFKLFFLF